jgi:hypothetical protein
MLIYQRVNGFLFGSQAGSVRWQNSSNAIDDAEKVMQWAIQAVKTQIHKGLKNMGTVGD